MHPAFFTADLGQPSLDTTRKVLDAKASQVVVFSFFGKHKQHYSARSHIATGFRR